MYKVTSNELTIRFDNPSMAAHFMTWLCEMGEQDYWQWMEGVECKEPPESEPITAALFEYEPDNNLIIGRNQ